jgi:hypothetical protein
MGRLQSEDLHLGGGVLHGQTRGGQESCLCLALPGPKLIERHTLGSGRQLALAFFAFIALFVAAYLKPKSNRIPNWRLNLMQIELVKKEWADFTGIVQGLFLFFSGLPMLPLSIAALVMVFSATRQRIAKRCAQIVLWVLLVQSLVFITLIFSIGY